LKLAAARRLRDVGVLGINGRNGLYIQEHNPRRLYPLVDDKVRTKHLAEAAGIAVPDLYGLVRIQHEIRDLGRLLGSFDDFVIKPAQGSGGNGILVVTGQRHGRYRTAGGTLIELSELQHYVSNILSGAYSLGGHPDVAMIEYRVKFDPIFEPVTYRGVPDIRIIVFLGVPVMAMVRLPTRGSDGRANLHQGAIGAGICFGDGRTLSAVWNDEIITEHPDTGHPVGGVEIPHWQRLLTLAAGCYELTGLGYLGVDLVLDRDRGPLMLELNARPGLAVQIANRAGLQGRLDKARKALRRLRGVDERVAWARETFAAAPVVGAA
jgi:alpha-L-glutamate ligase-like protein